MNDLERMDRREAIKWMLTAAATVSVLHAPHLGAAASARGYGQDPNLMEAYKPGDLWPLTFSLEQHGTVAALCDVILPSDEKSPSASQLKVPDFIDEWISAPYPAQRADRGLILEGIDWLAKESRKRFHKLFADLSEAEKQRICDDICFEPKANGDLKRAAQFFARFRDLTSGAFYTTVEGMKDLQYLGNLPLTKFDGPPPEVLAHLKLQ
jgi:hypothetical protein